MGRKHGVTALCGLGAAILLAIVGWANLPWNGTSNLGAMYHYTRLLGHLFGWLPRPRDGKYGKHRPPAPRQSNGTITEVQGFVSIETFREKYLWKEPVVFRGAATPENGFELGCLTDTGRPANEALRKALGQNKIRVFRNEHDDASAKFMTIADYERLAERARANDSNPTPYARSFRQDTMEGCAPIPSAKLKKYRSRAALTFLPEDSALVFYSANKGTTTKMHMDIGDSFFTQVMGRKKWLLADPQYAPELQLYADTRNLVFVSGYDVHGEPVPNKMLVKEVVLHPRDILYFPPMCFHAVYNLDDVTIGIDELAMDPVGGFTRHWLFTLATVFNPHLTFAVLRQLWEKGKFSGYDLYFDGFSKKEQEL